MIGLDSAGKSTVLSIMRELSRSKPALQVAEVQAPRTVGPTIPADAAQRVREQTPTVGLAPPVSFALDFNSTARQGVRSHPRSLVIRDVGGASRYRSAWPSAIRQSHAVVFVLDSSPSQDKSESDRPFIRGRRLNRQVEVKQVLREVLDLDECVGKPILFLANKQDRDGAFSSG